MSNFFLWESASSEKYTSFSTTIPSDIPAYQAVYQALALKGKRVLDFGCFRGKSAVKLLEQGAAHVVGVDNVAAHIEAAKEMYSDKQAMKFFHVPEDAELSETEPFDAVCMTFVHVTIPDFQTLVFQFKKIADRMRSGAPLVLLGLHPQSF